jgi:hypothetical protein
LPIDIVGISKMQKCGLKYVIYAFAVIELSLDNLSLYSSCAQTLEKKSWCSKTNPRLPGTPQMFLAPSEIL